MARLFVTGNGPLNGTIRASGAKNAVLPIMAATILASEPVTLHNVPALKDVDTCCELLSALGAQIHRQANTLIIDPRHIHHAYAPYEIVSRMRASFVVLGPLLARFAEAKVSLPGGCQIGTRGVDQHLKGLQLLNADIQLDNGYVIASAPQGRLISNNIVFDVVTVTGTANVVMAATLAKGITRIENCAKEPEVADLCHMLTILGAKIDGIGTETLVIQGVDKLSGGEYTVMPDRIEVGTYLVAAAMTYGHITVESCQPVHQYAILEKLQQAGCHTSITHNSITIKPDAKRLQSVNIRTAPYPLFATDMQAQFMALNSIANGTGKVVETIFENRFMHVAELRRMGACIDTEGNTAIIRGVDQLSGAEVTATDLRASACLVLAGLTANGTTIMNAVHHLQRGYDNLSDKLSQLGAKISLQE